MSKGRLEAFSDGVLAIAITITVLKLTSPESIDRASLAALTPLLLAYTIGYTFVGLQWLNHHRVFDSLEQVTSKIIWKNLNWLFWMTLIPFAVEWSGLRPFEPIPATVFVQFC